jgi:hypothetical protein
MKLNSKNTITLMAILFTFIISFSVIAQETQDVSEPPIPVYFIYPNQLDSHKVIYESPLPPNEVALAYTMKKYDSLQVQLQKLSTESTLQFGWLYVLITLFGIMNIVQLFLISRIRKELLQLKRIEHTQKLSTNEGSVDSIPAQSQKGSLSKDTKVKVSSSQSRKIRSKKS